MKEDFELRKQVHRALGKPILTEEQMRAEAERVWLKQPACRSFMMGFSVGESDDAWVFQQSIPPYECDANLSEELFSTECDRYDIDFHVHNRHNGDYGCFVTTQRLNVPDSRRTFSGLTFSLARAKALIALLERYSRIIP